MQRKYSKTTLNFSHLWSWTRKWAEVRDGHRKAERKLIFFCVFISLLKRTAQPINTGKLL